MNQISSPQTSTPTRPAQATPAQSPAGLPVQTGLRAGVQPGECVRFGNVMVCR